jgi:hypothetical protein
MLPRLAGAPRLEGAGCGRGDGPIDAPQHPHHDGEDDEEGDRAGELRTGVQAEHDLLNMRLTMIRRPHDEAPPTPR